MQFIILLTCVLLLPVYALASIHHELTVTVDPQKKALKVTDKVSFPEAFLNNSNRSVKFILHQGFVLSDENVEHVKEMGNPDMDPVPLNLYQISLPDHINQAELTYQGTIYHPVEKLTEEYAGSFSETPGIIDETGVFMAGSTYWYPVFNDELVTFTLDVHLPEAWNIVSQGERTNLTQGKGSVKVRWESPEPQEEIYLVAGRFTEYSQKAGQVQTYVFLRSPDKALADKYLDATGQYLKMYSNLIGPYPYKKFALVENFWETGYGMPSFTLLGPTVIRLPFILHTAYPHEILHNWWGNGVYVDYGQGNWCEGLTAYLADYLNQEKAGKGAEYRRTTLQKYTDYVAQGKDFPLTEFRSRHSAATEAVGYGKALMVFHMLRRQLGDDLFFKGLQNFYKENKFKRASYRDLELSFTKPAGGQSLSSFFAQWITRTGAPALSVGTPKATKNQQGYSIHITVNQIQPEPAYALKLPVAVIMEGHDKPWKSTVDIMQKQQALSLQIPAKPLQLNIDSDFDLFRKLDRREIPPALSQAFGAEQALFVLPASAPEKLLIAYRQTAQRWLNSKTLHGAIKLDTELTQLPKDRAVWIFGWQNRFFKEFAETIRQYPITVSESSIKLEGNEFTRLNHTVVITARQHIDQAVVWIGTDSPSAFPGLSQKLPHYSKYSYLVFEGDEPTNVLKGQWPVVDSPLAIRINGK
jgi:hypothetical protein